MISVLLPTRNRPRNIARFIDSLYQNSRAGDILNNLEFLFYVDTDDNLSIPELEYQRKEYEGLINIRWMVGERKPISNTYNDLYRMIEKPDIVCITGDDITSNTEGWDLIVADAFNKYKDRLVLVGGRDLFNDNLFTTFFLSKEWIDVVGYVTPNEFYDYTDTFIHSIASMIGRIEKVNAVFEHHHPSAGKCSVDDTMREKNLRCYGGMNPSHILYDKTKDEREKIAQKLLEKIKC